MLEIEDVHNYYPGEEDLRFPIITALRPQDFQTIYITKNGHKIIRIKQDCYSSRRRKKQKKRDRRKEIEEKRAGRVIRHVR